MTALVSHFTSVIFNNLFSPRLKVGGETAPSSGYMSLRDLFLDNFLTKQICKYKTVVQRKQTRPFFKALICIYVVLNWILIPENFLFLQIS